MPNHGIVHVEISAPDPKTTSQFYAQLFGWKIETDERFDYTQFTGNGGPGGAFVKVDNQTYKRGDVVPYVSTDDIDASLKRAEELGATIVMPKIEIPDTGWAAIFMDPSGNRIGLYQSMHP